ncbi:MAG TPA: hypothetical protein VFM92_10300 [Marivirga sp.]|nr:hypothetical protein [Marivirga sp.]
MTKKETQSITTASMKMERYTSLVVPILQYENGYNPFQYQKK